GERVTQPESRAGRSGRRLLRAGPGHVHRRPPPGGVVWRPLPGGVPDRRGRSPAPGRRVRLRGGLAVDGRSPFPGADQRRARVRERPTHHPVLQMNRSYEERSEVGRPPMNITLQVWRQERADRPGKFVTYQVNDIEPEVAFVQML